jgi:hypothetical protein
MWKREFTEADEKCLRDQVITADQPGPVLHDFQIVLDYVGSEGVEAGGKYNLLPIKCIPELDPLLSRPLKLELKRPQLKSHPYLQGLNLLLRASGLSRVEGKGDKARLVLDQEMLAQWDQLNPTEQYFQLLEAWLRFGRGEMVGETRGRSDGLIFKCLMAWQLLREKRWKANLKEKPENLYVPGFYRDLYLLALMDLFGILKVTHAPKPVTPWIPAAIQTTPFGDALFAWFLKSEDGEEGKEEERDEAAAPAILPFGRFLLEPIPDPELEGDWEDEEWEGDEEDEDEAGEEENAPEGDGEEQFIEDLDEFQFGEWQPLFQPFFPEWRNNLKFPEIPPREGTFVFRVNLGKNVWRRIAMPDNATLDDLAYAILDSVDFDDDEHLYEFTYRNRFGGKSSVSHPYMDEGPWGDRVRLATFPLELGQTMEFLFDFGDSWEFDVTLEKIEPPGGKSKIKKPKILEKHGKAPRQYPDWYD